MLNRLCFSLIVLCLYPLQLTANTLISVNTGAFIYHSFPKKSNSTQYFNNNYFSIERKIDADSDYSLMVGTLLNSQNNRCILLGIRKDWYHFSNKLVIKGVYAYAGEFFFDAFEDCGDGGDYKKVKEKIGVGFVPYLYHAAQYNFTDYFAVEGGVILPGIVVVSMQWSF